MSKKGYVIVSADNNAQELYVKIDADRLEDAMDYMKNHGDYIKLPSEAN